MRVGGDAAAQLRALLEEHVPVRQARTGAELVAFFRASPFTDLEPEVQRDRSPGRLVDL